VTFWSSALAGDHLYICSVNLILDVASIRNVFSKYKSVFIKRPNVVCCAVNNKAVDETRSGCLQLDDDIEFPAIGHSAVIY